MPGLTTRSERLLWRPLALLDAAMNRLYGWRYNPLYQSGALAIALLLVVTVTGLYLLLFYRIGAPYESVERMAGQVWSGRWIRTLHRYASDAAVVAVAVHSLRLFAQGRSWGPRTLAWVSGAFLLFLVFVCGWTGYVMVWDVQGKVLAVAGAQLLDALPLFAEPISRAFVGETELPNAFFFLNLFVHIALPVGFGLLLWIHVSRVARPALLPPRALMWGVIFLLFALSVVWPASMGPKANPFQLATRAPFDLFYSFWLPLMRAAPAEFVWFAFLAVASLILFVPMLARPKGVSRPEPSWVDQRYCTGCEQCYLDCPYEAIEMIERSKDRSKPVARVDPSLCVSCGICAGSCAPMRVGPPNRTGREQLAQINAFVAHLAERRDVVLVACERSAALAMRSGAPKGAALYSAACAGSVHSSVIESLLRAGFRGVMVVACPPRDCRNREGATWLDQRLYHDREAELQARVDRRRVRLVYASAAEVGQLERELRAFHQALSALEVEAAESELDLIRMCETAQEGAQS